MAKSTSRIHFKRGETQFTLSGPGWVVVAVAVLGTLLLLALRF